MKRFPLLLVGAPLLLMVILTITILFPALKDPESKMYSSGIGYPAIKRKLGQPIKVDVAEVKMKNVSNPIAASGESVALEEVTIGPLVQGVVQQIYVREGEWVKKGQPLLKIDQTVFLEQVKQYQNDLSIAQNQLRILPQQQADRLLQLEADVNNYKTQLKLTENNLLQMQQGNQGEVSALKAELANIVSRMNLLEERLKQIKLLADEGAVSTSALNQTQQEYLTVQQEYIVTQKNLALEKSNFNIELNNTKQTYANEKKDLIKAQQDLNQFLQNRASELETARLRVANNKIALSQAQRNLTQTLLEAPIDGLVSKVNIDNGETATIRTSAITLTQDVVFKAYIDQAKLNEVKIGDLTDVNLISYPGQSFAGKVIKLNPTVQTEITQRGQTGQDRQYTYSAWIEISDLQMPPGLQGYALFYEDSNEIENSLMIPENSVIHLSEGEGMVMVVQNNEAVVRKVKLGRIFDNQREVIGGLSKGEKVVISPRALNPGDSVKVRDSGSIPVLSRKDRYV